MSPHCRATIVRLRNAIFAAQTEVRTKISEYLEGKDPTLRATVEGVEGVMEREEDCFRECVSIVEEVVPNLSVTDFVPR